MIKVGIVGIGFMGRMHFSQYKAHEDVEIAAICDTDENKFEQQDVAAGNVPGADKPLDFTGIELYSDFDKMLAEANLDAVSITLPTYMHRDYTLKALNAGLNVLCEKPMAVNVEQCEEMITLAEKKNKVLQVGHCLRFWPEYAKTKEIIDSGEYGQVKVATFQRLSLTPTWSWNNWLMAPKGRSGGALMDLHIHDADYIQYVFGMPKAVSAHATIFTSEDFDHVVTSYIYDDDKVITAEGGWAMAPGFGFEMSFNIILEKATIVYDCTKDPAFKVCKAEGDSFTPELEKTDGYAQEIAHFIKSIKGQSVPPVITPQQSLNSVKLILAEKQSAETRKEVQIK
ncbi:MAG: Gfo/Idh/MocA family protein [Planctomycetota bacterium]|jgi:predicted dehydrogenase